MRKFLRTLVVPVAATTAVAFVVASCSDDEESEPLAVQLVHPQGHEDAMPFTANGPAVDTGIICAAGTMEMDNLESIDGDALTDEDWAGMFDAAMESGGIAEMYVVEAWTCDDGGTFTIRFHNRFDFASFEFEGRQDVGSWEISEASGTLEGVAGSGDVTLDWDAEEVLYDGEAQR